MEKFWVVMRDKDQSYVSKRHPDMNSAQEEAMRLAKKENHRFFVLECMGAVQPSTPPVEWVVAEYVIDDIPF